MTTTPAQFPEPEEEEQALGRQQKQRPVEGETIGATSEADDPALEKDPEDWVSGDDPMTEAQKSYLDTLARQAGEELPADLTKAEASEHIDRLRGPQ
ncbi:DUF3072 domain-containing protein [Citricoccus alkalitolerans]|uniref:DUF3072 domain-containing protein n=1 Tax=Citricoccus alkalitolerans TaxID=246603 RepID=A0ABV8XU10_9MICC